MNNQEVHQYLESNCINPSVQRAAIMQYMLEHYDHPTVEQVYADLLPDMPTLSKATVYNTLKLFVDKKAVLALSIDDKNVRYDAHTHVHAHFRCRYCGIIHDVPLEKTEIPPFKGGSEYMLTESQVYYFGTCTKCVDATSL